MKDANIQWHPGFVAAMSLELKGYRHNLTFLKEHTLNTKPLAVDLLIIKKRPEVSISNDIGVFFRGHNIIEYKSPDDGLNIDVFYKFMAYAGLYKSYGETVNERKADDITVTLIRESSPDKLFQYFQTHGFSVTSPSRGVYYIEGRLLFPAQIIVTKELDASSHAWLKALSANLNKEDIRSLIDCARSLLDPSDKELADSVLEVSFNANPKAIQELIGDDTMYDVLLEFMEPRLSIRDREKLEEGRREGLIEGQREGRIEGLREGIQKSIDTLRAFGHQDLEIKEAIMKQFGLSEKEANPFF